MKKSSLSTVRNEYKIDFSFSPSIRNVRKFAILGRKVIELFWPHDEKLAFEIELCLVEALSNVIFHAQEMHSDAKVCYQLKGNPYKLIIRVFDCGRGFSLSDYFSKEVNPYQPNGRGLKLIRSFVDDMKYVRGKNRNELIY